MKKQPALNLGLPSPLDPSKASEARSPKQVTVKVALAPANVHLPQLPDPGRSAAVPASEPTSGPVSAPTPASASELTLSRKDGKPQRGRSIPRAVRRAVYARDEGRCPWTAQDGRVCRSRTFFEFNHRKAFALGGEHTVDNINLLCRAHDPFDAIAVFGAAAIARRRHSLG
jgi:5-methylcytosine-specific restriction endonuclease McrA